MTSNNVAICSLCGGSCGQYDSVKRIVRKSYGRAEWITVKRYRCEECHRVWRELPVNLYSFKHYDRRIIDGFRDGSLSVCMIEYEDRPCEQTIANWKRAVFH